MAHSLRNALKKLAAAGPESNRPSYVVGRGGPRSHSPTALDSSQYEYENPSQEYARLGMEDWKAGLKEVDEPVHEKTLVEEFRDELKLAELRRPTGYQNFIDVKEPWDGDKFEEFQGRDLTREGKTVIRDKRFTEKNLEKEAAKRRKRRTLEIAGSAASGAYLGHEFGRLFFPKFTPRMGFVTGALGLGALAAMS